MCSGPDKRLRIDYADLDVPTGLTSRRDGNTSGAEGGGDTSRGNNYRSYRDEAGGSSGGGGPRSYRDGSVERGRRHSGSPDPRSRSGSPRGSGGSLDGAADLASAQTVADIAKKTSKVWDGGLILKNSLFPTKLHLIEGNRRIADALKERLYFCMLWRGHTFASPETIGILIIYYKCKWFFFSF